MGGEPPKYSDVFEVILVSSVTQRPQSDADAWFIVSLKRPEGPGGALLRVDRNLNLLEVVPNGAEPIRSTEDWRTLWVPVIQQGEYLSDKR
jgi:hypothetical protein